MFLLEHDAKTLLSRGGIRIPDGILIESTSALDDAVLPAGPWVVKAQIPAGGRGKAGGVRVVDEESGLRAAVRDLLGARISAHPVGAVQVERRIENAAEAYLSLMVDPTEAGIRVLLSAEGGTEIEASARCGGSLATAVAAPDAVAITDAARRLVDGDLSDDVSHTTRAALISACELLTPIFLSLEALLLEINPLFALADGAWIAGDAKLVVDDNAFGRNRLLDDILDRRGDAYPSARFKRENGFDYVELDPDGSIGLLTTGAGLSMMLIDELRAQGLRPLNFLDIRTGELRGDPARLIEVLARFAAAPALRVVLVNIFAGITHLGEFARLLLDALEATPKLRAPIVARLVGNDLEEAREVLAPIGDRIHIEPDLGRALDAVAGHLDGGDNR
ncbi:MAG: acetate--CoA ligase family protein [Alphaproteobacteria bacterium]|jgi:succinyl-CoA synthetase beta subunit|nr:acetate--CoA ligase family protein [Alphaproteobacteria bacterium]